MLHRDTSRIASDTGASGGYTWLLISGTLGISVRGRSRLCAKSFVVICFARSGSMIASCCLVIREHHGELARHAKLGYLSKLLQSRNRGRELVSAKGEHIRQVVRPYANVLAGDDP